MKRLLRRLRFRWRLVLAALGLAFLPVFGAEANTRATENLIIVSVDGLRVQEMFGGIDPLMLTDTERSGIEDLDALKEAYWRETPGERRMALFPFFWGELINEGVILGNPEKNSHVKLGNPHMFSYPGYAEMLTGEYQEAIVSNDPVQNPVPTVLDFLREGMGLDSRRVAAFCSWSVFNAICTRRDGSFYVNAGYEAVPRGMAVDGMEPLNRLQFQMATPWDSVRFDAVTGGLALEYLRVYRPRVLYVALGETDDWGHERRYDRVINAARYFDDFLRELWAEINAIPQYRGKTSLLMATDHGRGVTLDDWTDHSDAAPGSEDVWFAAIGPDTPNGGELSDTPEYRLGGLAATALELMGFDYKTYNPDAYPPVAEAMGNGG